MESNINIQTLNIDGNRIAVLFLDGSVNFALNEKDYAFREHLVQTYAQKVDSIIFLQQCATGYNFSVFEPNQSSVGTFSQLCGNGLKAASSILPGEKVTLHTGAGSFKALNNGQQTEIHAGKYVCCGDAASSILSGSINEVKVAVKQVFDKTSLPRPIVCLGYNSENASYCGEPHMVIMFLSEITSERLVDIAAMYTPAIKDRIQCHQDVNVTYASFGKLTHDACYLNACTFERNLSDDPAIAITGSCGTGAMAVSNTFYKKVLKRKMKKLHCRVTFPKATLNVSIVRGSTILYGKTLYENL